MKPWLVISALLLSACGAKKATADLPNVELANFQPSVREAIDSALAAARVKPDDAAVAARLGMVLHAHNQFAAAAKAYGRAAMLDPGSPTYSYYLGTVLAADGRYAEAVKPLRDSLVLPVARLRLADALYAAGQPVDARREYEQLISSEPNNAAAYYGLGRCLQGNEAIAAFQKAVELFPRYGAARFSLAAVYRQQGLRAQADAALENYERDKLLSPPQDDRAVAAVLELDASTTGLLRAAQSLERQGQLAPAAALQERATAADPKLTQAWVNLISLYARLNQTVKAEEAYAQAAKLDPRNAEAHYNFGVFCARSDRMIEAKKAFEAAIAADPNYAEALDNLGAVVETGGAWDQAAALYRRAVAAKPTLHLAHYHLGRSLVNQRRLPEAIHEFEQAATAKDDQLPGFLYALGATHARAGNRSKAIEILGRARTEASILQQSQLSTAIEADLAKLQPQKR